MSVNQAPGNAKLWSCLNAKVAILEFASECVRREASQSAGVQVRVQAGARVQDVVEALRPHGLTLQNFASVREQQVGGFTQVSAHGTGASIPPVDEQVLPPPSQ
jgi:FAD binding domain